MGTMLKRRRTWLVLTGLVVGLSACTSMVENLPPGLRFSSAYRTVNAYLERKDFSGAREALDSAGIGANPSAEKLRDRDSAAARHVFQEQITRAFLEEQRQLVGEGRPRFAENRLNKAVALCPWCEELVTAKQSAAATVSELDRFGDRVRGVSQQRPDAAGDREVLNEARKWDALLGDSPAIQRDVSHVRTHLADIWAKRARNTQISQSDLSAFNDDLALIAASNDVRERLSLEFQLLTVYPPRLIDDKRNRDALLTLARSSPPRYPVEVSGLSDALGQSLTALATHVIGKRLRDPDVDYTSLAFAEQLLSATADKQLELRKAIVQAHLSRAAHLAGSGRSAVLALLHTARAEALAPKPAESQAAIIRAKAASSFSTAGRLRVSIRIETNPSDEPILQDLARFGLKRAITQHLRSHISPEFISAYQKTSDIDISLQSVQMFIPSASDLTAKTSSYLSHYQDVPNPAKRALRSQLDYQRISVDSARSTYDYAVSSFNISPSDWGLQNVNMARNTYNMAVDQYNNLVNLYNATPSTISQPVYLPYIFREGTVRHGWRVRGSVRIGGATENFDIADIDSDFVRLGTRPDDSDASHRRDDLLDIPVGTDRLSTQLIKVSEGIEERVAEAAKSFTVNVGPQLSPEERKLVSFALFPFTEGRPSTSNLPGWAEEAEVHLTLPDIGDSAVPTVRVMAARAHPKGTAPQDFASFYGPAVALIKNRDGSFGSGAVISPDGLVLTAAHVLTAEPYEVAFPRSGDNRRWRATPLFINELHDVALLRIADYHADRWFDVSLLDSANAGEPVVAMGNPDIGGLGTAAGSISNGIVAKPYDPKRSDGLTDIVVDIAIASGSSGGPLVSRKTGKIVGVVTAVVKPSITNDFASSGYWAVAAPSNELGKWLGLAYER